MRKYSPEHEIIKHLLNAKYLAIKNYDTEISYEISKIIKIAENLRDNIYSNEHGLNTPEDFDKYLLNLDEVRN